MKISFVIAARNDDHGRGFLARLQRSIGNLFVLASKIALDAELIIVEWNNPLGAPGLQNVLDWKSASIPTRVIQVPAEVHATIPQKGEFSMFVNIAENVGIRRAQGSFVLVATADILYSEDMINCLGNTSFDEDCFYNAVRHDIDDKDKVVEIRRSYHTDPIHGVLFDQAPGDFTMMARNRWEKIRGYPEVPFNTYVDGAALYAALDLGMRQVVLPHPIYHMNHGVAERDSRPVWDLSKKYPLNNDSWGFRDIKFNETLILSKGD